MYILLVISWVLCIIQNFIFNQTIYKKFGEPTVWMIGFGTWIVSFALTAGILSDVFSPYHVLTIGRFVVLSGPVNLAIQSLTSFILANQNKRKIKKISFTKIAFDSISLLASVLGIVSFYLDHIIK
jgi:hypothetical protein